VTIGLLRVGWVDKMNIIPTAVLKNFMSIKSIDVKE